MNWGRSRSDENDAVKASDDDIPVLHATSFRNEDFVFETQIVTEEVAAAIRRLKCRKAPSPDGIQSENLKYGDLRDDNSVVNPAW